MNVLIVGSGGREHALAWRLASSPSVESVVVSPGNPGMSETVGVTVEAGEVSPEDAVTRGIGLVVIGPEEPLVNGLADAYRAAGIPVVGPSAEAARLEGSKAFAKEFMARHRIPTAEYRVCSSIKAARAAVEELGAPVVVKADGLAAGKGVTVCETEREAHAAIESIMRDRLFGDAGDVVVVERRLSGFEASIIVLVDESGYVVLPTAQDHKPIGEGNVGPNTGGMGVVAPNPMIDDELHRRIEVEIVKPSVTAIGETGWLFRGVLFIGLMIDEGRPFTLEYNVRFGDPETQAILPLLHGDFGTVLHGLSEGRVTAALEEASFSVGSQACCAVIAASAGYPGPYSKGEPIHRDSLPSTSTVARDGAIFFAGVAASDRSAESVPLVTAGGRVLAAVAVGEDLAAARISAYALLQTVHFDGMQYRRDIGGAPVIQRVLEEEQLLVPQFSKRGGVLPVVVQDDRSGDVLMVAYTDRTALERTRSSGYAAFWSTSRNVIWTKGETSGDYLQVTEIRVDCDQDALLYRVIPIGGGVCHTVNVAGSHRRRCFYRRLSESGVLEFDE